MAAKTAVELNMTWSAVIELLNQGYWVSSTAPTSSVSISSIGCSANWTYATTYDQSFIGVWHGFDLTISAPGMGNSTTQRFYLKVDEGNGLVEHPVDAPKGIVVHGGDISASVQMSVSGLFVKGSVSDSVPSNRQLMDFTDRSASYSWYADTTTTATITVTAPSFSASKTGNLSYSDEEIDLGTDFYLSYGFSIARFANNDEVYARISSITWDSIDIDLTNCDLYNPGSGIAPDSSNPNWKRIKSNSDCRIGNDGGIAIWREAGNTSTTASWSGWTKCPYQVQFKPIDGKFDDDTDYDITYISPWIRWKDSTNWEYETFNDNSEIITESQSSWEFTYEWQKFLTHSFFVWEENDWRENNRENVGGGVPAENDRQAGICLYPITAGSFTGDVLWSEIDFVTITLDDNINVLDPVGITRPSEWVGSTGVTVGSPDSDVWTVANTASTPTVKRDFKTRYWLRMDRLSGGYIEGLEYNTDWPIMLKANIANPLDDEDWANSIPYEDIYNWSNYSYLDLAITSPQDGDVTFKINFSVPSISDPCYTCAEHRWEEFSYSRTQQTLTYTIPVTAGSNSVLLDLCLNNEKVVPRGNYRIQVIDSLEFVLPENETESDVQWEITKMDLVLDPNHEGHCNYRFKRPWDWNNPDWVGFGANVDGKPILEVDYGYGGTFNHTRYEKALMHIYHRQHCPDNGLTDRLDAAKAMSALVSELNYQEGFTATYHNPENSSANKDADGAKLSSTFYWWDLHNNHSYDETTNVFRGAVQVGTVTIVAGVKIDINFYKYPQGKIHGLAFNNDWNKRLRNTNGVKVYGTLNDGVNWQFMHQVSTNQHGYFKTEPVLEKDYKYAIQKTDHFLQVANAEYTPLDTILIPIPAGVKRLAIDNQHEGDTIYRLGKHESGYQVEYLPYGDSNWVSLGFPFSGSTWDYPSITYVNDNGKILVSAYHTTEEKTYLRYRVSDNNWSDLGLSTIAADLTNVDIDDWAGMLWVAGWMDDATVHVRCSSKTDYSAEDTPIDLIISEVPAIEEDGESRAPAISLRVADDSRTIFVVVETTSGMKTYYSRNTSEGFVELV